MYATIESEGSQIIVLDLVNQYGGFLFFRIVGPEVAINATFAKMVAKKPKTVIVKQPGETYGTHVSPERYIRYKSFRSKLPNGMVDLAMIHPVLTVTEDSPEGFYILTYDDGVPSGFFERLNKTLSIPLKPEWESWLWEKGQEQVKWTGIQDDRVWEDGRYVNKPESQAFSDTPIVSVSSEIGDISCYKVDTGGKSKEAWLTIVRQELALGIRLTPMAGDYLNGVWSVSVSGGEWVLRHRNEGELLRANKLDFLLAQARTEKGLNLILEEA